MSIIRNTTLHLLRGGNMALGFGVTHLRTVAAPMMARAAGYDWLFIDMEHGAFSVQEATQLCLAALPTGVTPIVRVCADALDEGTRALDNGAQGIVVPHVDTLAQAERVADAFRFAPRGTRSWGSPIAQFGFASPDPASAQEEIDREVLIVAMIETMEAVANADAIAAVAGIDVLQIGTSDLTLDMGISGQIGHARVQDAYGEVASACARHGKVLGMGGVYDETYARLYIRSGARFVFAGADGGFLMAAATARANLLRAG